MRNEKTTALSFVLARFQVLLWPVSSRGTTSTRGKALRFVLCVMLIVPGLALSPISRAQVTTRGTKSITTEPVTVSKEPGQGGTTLYPTSQPITVHPPVNVSQIAVQEALEPTQVAPAEIKSINPPKERPEIHQPVAIPANLGVSAGAETQAPPPSPTGISPGPSRSFKGQELLGTVIPPDTGGAVGTTHIVTVTNDRMRILDRNGVVISTVTLSSFWSGVALEGGAAVSAFDPKITFDRFNNRYFFVSSANAQTLSSAALIAVSATADPTGTWFRYSIDADPAATAATGKWIDYPTIGFNNNWLVLMENEFNYGTAGTGYWGPALFVMDKALLYTGPVSITASVFQADFNAVCLTSLTQATELACGFTMAPAITEDNTTSTEYLVEDWDTTAGQLRLSKLTGTPSAPVLTIATQFPQSANSWQFVAGISPAGSGGYAIQRQQNAYLTSGARISQNDSRIQNSVFRNGSLWTTHAAAVSTVPQPAGVATSAANPHNHTAIQWWQIDPTIETGLATPPLQRARIEDPTADNCNNNAGASRAGCTPQGQFFAFPHISVNMNNDALIGYTRFSERTYASAAYSLRMSADAPNTTRDPVVFRAGQGNYNLLGGTSVRWGDMSHAQTDPLNDTDFWTTQEYADVQRDVGIGIAGTWATWWAQVSPSTPAASTTGNLIISEFRLRGPQGVRDEFVELYNPGTSPLIVTTTDGSDGWALAYSTTAGVVSGVTTIPVGTVIPAQGHYLITDNQTPTQGPTLVYSLLGYPNTAFRDSGGDTGYSLDNADNGGFAIFKSSIVANWTAATRMDSAGFSGVPAGLFKEGAGITPITGAPTGQMTFFRSLSTGVPKDTNANENDFLFVDPVLEVLAVTPRLGAAGPENLDSPIQRNASIATGLPFPCMGAAAIPNRVRDLTPAPPNGANGTLDIRRTFTNNLAVPITRLRFRVVDVTTTPVGAGIADIRLLDGALVTVLSGSNPCGTGTITIGGMAVETPPAQVNGGAFNSTATAGTITLATPLLAGASVNLHFLLGVQVPGSFRFFVNIEALQ